MERNRSTDPHIERLIEAFALLTGRIQHKLDDDFPELTTALLGVLYPHYLAPVPSMAIVQFDIDPARAQLPNGFRIGQHSRLSTNPIGDLPCKYRTGYPVTLWPIQVIGCKFTGPPFPRGISAPPNSKSLLRIQLDCLSGMKFSDLTLDTLRFYLTGENETIAQLYEFLFNHVLQVVFLAPEGTANPSPVVFSPRESLFPVGFDIDDGLLPYPSQSFLGYRLLSEYFALPEKFHFLDLGGFRQVCRSGFQKRLDVLLFLNRASSKLAQDINAETFRLGCTPAINLFEQTAEPIPLTQARYEYRIVPDVANPDGMEVYSVDDVVSVDPIAGTTSEYFPFYSFHHGMTARRNEDVLVCIAKAVPSRVGPRCERPRHRRVSQLGGPELRPQSALRSDACRANDMHQPRASLDPAAGRRTTNLRPGGGRSVGADPLRAVTVEPVATTNEARDLLEAGFPPLSQPSLPGEFG